RGSSPASPGARCRRSVATVTDGLIGGSAGALAVERDWCLSWVVACRVCLVPFCGLAVAQVGGVMDVPAKPPARAAAARGPLEQAGIRRSPRRRRPSGQPPPLPRHLQTTGVGWLAA